MEWKLEVQADFIFKKLLSNKEAIFNEAMSMLKDVAEVQAPKRNDKEKLERNNKQLEKLRRQMANLVDMCADGDISREVIRSKKKKLEDQISNLEKMLMYGKEASNRKQEIDRQHYTIPNQRPKDKHCGKI